jgi:hypothetical protein
VADRSRPVLVVAVIAAAIAVVAFVPWGHLASSALRFMRDEAQDAPAWVPMDGRAYNVALFPELSSTLGARYGGDGKVTFRVPQAGDDQYGLLANDRFGTRLLFRCIATRRLEDDTPAGTVGWCREYPQQWTGR